MGKDRAFLRKRRNLHPENPSVLPCPVWGQAARPWGKVWWDPDMESPQADVPASFKTPSSTWLCLRLSPVSRAGGSSARPK